MIKKKLTLIANGSYYTRGNEKWYFLGILIFNRIVNIEGA